MSVDINKAIHLLCFFGVSISYYAYVVETTKEHDDSYVAMCDISEHMSCSKAFMSVYGKGFGLIRHVFGEDSILNQPNSLGGMLFYCIIFGLNLVNSIPATKLMLALVVVSNFASVYLGYILLFVLYDFCVVCVTTYVINLGNLILTIKKLQRLSVHRQSPAKATSKKRN